MLPFKINIPWHEVKEKLKEININLDDEDLDYEPGKENELLSRLQKKIKGSRDDIRAIIESVSGNEGKAG